MTTTSTPPSQPPSDTEMSLVGHLLEFRDRLVRAIIAIIVVFLVLFPFANELYSFMAEPLTSHLPQGSSMMAIGVISPFLTPLKLALIASIFLSMPFLLYQLWGFIAPALYHSEKRLAAPMLVASTVLFYAGGAFVFYIVFPLVFKFMAGTTPDGVQIGTDIQLYLDFVIGMFFAFGLAFQVPVITVLLLVINAVTPEKMRHARPYVIVGAFSIAAFITPPDVISQTLLAVPMWLMYEIGLWFGERMVNQRLAEQQTTENEPTPPTTSPASEGATQQAAATTGVVSVMGLDSINNAIAQDAAMDFAQSNLAHEPPKDAIVDNALNSDEDFERAFAQMDNELNALNTPVATVEPAPIVDDDLTQVKTEALAESSKK
jgi:sec-independent protein translocase protein TatC